MLIGLCGGTCSGKYSIAQYLVNQHAFTILHIAQTREPSVSRPGFGAHKLDRTPVEESRYREFLSATDLFEFVTKNWQGRWVMPAIWDQSLLEPLSKRPFFLLVSVDAPVTLRWRRLKSQRESIGEPHPPLLEFVTDNDERFYNPTSGLAMLMERAQVRLINSSQSLQTLHEGLSMLNLMNEERLRPSWDQYFMRLSSLAAQRSNCMKRRVGCVLVREKRVISTGYNGTPRYLKNCNEGGCSRCNNGQGSGHGLSTCLCIHAEENALLEAGRERIREGSILYCDTCPCLTCSIKIAQVGISEVVYSQGYSMDQETAAIFAEAGVKFRHFSPPRQGLIHLNHVTS